jgi:hypothetical protein
MASALVRLNLNLPPAALEQAERARFRQRLEASRTQQRRARDLQIIGAIEGLRG